MTMDGSQLIESLESLWFFTNVVSSRTPNASNGIKEETTQPTSSILQTGQQNHDDHEFLTPACAECGGLAAEIEEHEADEPIVMVEEVEIPKPAKKEEKRKRRPRRKRSKRKMLGEVDLGVDRRSHSYKSGSGFGVFGDKEPHGMLGRQAQHQVKMPPLNDGMAMKEHLRSWAYAVAWTLR
ncbi:hypothetical protein SADUNF_Sadunf11G0045300 [Salix dunnii]|uniref:Uncharacterized protein n=1 Tax=Salix dunnii TaxID=1413687 RepID=A0A835MMX0_9ROSI|nr:hypothetical protein SADUNF_Sadunf11G0045300 [Salix dunnii]